MTSLRYEVDQAFAASHLAKLQRALFLLQQHTPPPDMPLHVATLLCEAITSWVNVVGDPWNNEAEPQGAPDLETLMQWMDDGICEATDGCRVECDGTCEHGHKSWLLELGLI